VVFVTVRTIPILPCRELDDVVGFYQAIGFEVTYRQARPNPYLCLSRSGFDLHFFGVETFEPEKSLGNVLVLVPDTGALYDAFAAGLRAAYGKVPVAGIPRITRPRRKQGTSGGFTVVDPGGNWLRISSSGSAPEAEGGGPFERVMLNAARQGDARGNEAAAIAVLEAGLTRHADATAVERVPVLVYLAELLVRSGDRGRAADVLAELRALELDDAASAEVGEELASASDLEAELS
jgi:hypothetical protein